MWLSWISPQIASAFTIKVTGKISGTGTGTGTGPGGGGEPIDIEAKWDGEVTSFTLAVRRKGSGHAFGGSAEVAAGHISNEGHQADIEITAKDAAGNPVAGVSVPTVRILSGGLGPSSTVTASVSMHGTTTDANGKATGIFTSGNRTEATTLIVDIDGDQETTEGEPTSTITQVWNELAGDEAAWDYPLDFWYEEPATINYTMSLDGGVPIAGHSLEFLNTGITGLEWNPDIGEDWTGWDENDEPDFIPDGDPDGAYEEKTYQELDTDPTGFWMWEGLSVFSGGSSNGGVYSTQQTILFDWDFILEKVWFDVYDDNVFGVAGQTE